MHYGVALPNFGTGINRLAMLDTALAVERLGYQSVWVNDYLALPEGDAPASSGHYEALVTLGYLAASTSRVRLGISALVLPLRSPLETARQLATLDVLSNGRVWVALGAGGSAGEFHNLGQNYHDRGRRLTEAIRVLRTLWRGNKVVSFRGKYYNFQKVVFGPPCVQHGGPPLWVAGNSAAALQRAVLHADGWHPSALSAAGLAEALAPVRPLLAGRSFEIVMRLPFSFNTSATLLHGTPAEMIAQLQDYHQAGLSGVVLECLAESQAERERQLERFAADVLPALS